MTPASEDEVGREWPFDYVRTALWFLAADASVKRAYLPGPFPETSFECAWGQSSTTCPLQFILMFCIEAIHAGIHCEEWDEAQEPNVVRDQLFRELHGIVWGAQAIAPESGIAFSMLESQSDSPFVGLCNAAQRYAVDISQRLSWGSVQEYPCIPCEHLLDENSNGSYSAAVNR